MGPAWPDATPRPIFPKDTSITRNSVYAPGNPRKTITPTPPHDRSSSADDAIDISKSTPPHPSSSHVDGIPEGVDAFKLSLLEYGRAIMKSTLSPELRPKDLEDGIVIAKNKVIAQYATTFDHLEETGTILNMSIQKAADANLAITSLQAEKEQMEEEQSARIQDLELEVDLMKVHQKDAETHLAEKERYERLWEEAEEAKEGALAELSELRQENKRKRDKMEEMCGIAERAMGS